MDMFPDGTVRVVFLASIGSGNASPVTVEDLYAAEVLFMKCGLPKERSAALRAEVKRNRVASVETTVDEEVAAKFRYTIPSR